MRVYDDQFFDAVDYSAARIADGILRHLRAQLPIKSVLDLGCGRGAWLAWWAAHGAPDILGVDGDYVDLQTLKITRSSFLAFDLTQSLELGRQFDLVQSLEVVEHLQPSAEDHFIDNIVRHGKLILFSAAIPGQGGSHHVNEQPWEYWRHKFAQRDFEIFDYLRPLIKDDDKILFWYRQNVFVYAHRSIVTSLPSVIQATRLEPNQPIENFLPYFTRLRNSIIGLLPMRTVSWLARMKWKFIMSNAKPPSR